MFIQQSMPPKSQKNAVSTENDIEDGSLYLIESTGMDNRNHEYYHTVVIATEKLSNSEAKPRCYDNFEGDNKRVVIFFNQHLLRSFQN